jgi:hypothetical protein
MEFKDIGIAIANGLRTGFGYIFYPFQMLVAGLVLLFNPNLKSNPPKN